LREVESQMIWKTRACRWRGHCDKK